VRASLEAAEVRLKGGLVSRADQLRARAALAEAEVALLTAERDQAKAEAALKQTAGIEQTRALVLDWKTSTPAALDAANLLAELLAEAQRQRPDLQALQAAAASASAEAGRARAARWPVLSLGASGGRTYFTEDNRDASNSYNFGVNLSVRCSTAPAGGRGTCRERDASACRPWWGRNATRWRAR